MRRVFYNRESFLPGKKERNPLDTSDPDNKRDYYFYLMRHELARHEAVIRSIDRNIDRLASTTFPDFRSEIDIPIQAPMTWQGLLGVAVGLLPIITAIILRLF